MLRVAQMMMAQALRFNASLNRFGDLKLLQEIVGEFIRPEGSYSIERMVEKAGSLFEMRPGDWFSPLQACQLLEALQDSSKQVSGSRRLALHVAFSQFCLDKAEEETKVAHLLMVAVRLGVAKAEPEELAKLVWLLQSEPACIGVLGGRPGRAHYIVGTT